MNIVELVKGYIGSEVVDQFAGKLGLDPSQARTAVNAAVPTTLAGFANVASTPEGARKLANAVDDQDDSMLNSISGMFANRGDSIMSHGSSMLNTLMGGGMMSGISNALSKFTGLPGNAITSLLGAIAPLILGVLKKQKNSQGLDASGLAGLLAGQKQNIASAMPAGLAGMLGNVPGLSSFKDWGREKAAQGYDVARDAYDTGRDTVSRGTTTVRGRTAPRETVGAGTGSSVWKWVLPLLLLGLITWVAVSWLSNRGRPAPVTPQRATSPQPADRQDTLGYVPADDPQTITADLKSISTETTQALSGVTDEASATQAATKIQNINSRLDRIHDAYTKLPADQRATISNSVSGIKSTIRTEIDRVAAIPGAGAVLDQPLNSMLDKLNGFHQ